ncbi:MAG: hypothetical protein ISS23_02620 [Nanoarchaeota archaeon]|nr:hypothetical protein [Nanoarchaeota archaeon]
MDLNVCLEVLIRLFFEIIRVLFGNITLLWKGGYLESEIPALLSTLKWIFFFTILTVIVKNRVLKNLFIIGVPAAFSFLIDLFGLIPFVGTFFSVGVGIAGIPIAALAWAFVLWTDEKVHPLLRFFATPGIMICAAINAVQPFSIVGDFSFALAIAYVPEIMAFFGIVFVGIVIILSPTFLCSILNSVLVKWADIRYEGLWSAVIGCLVVIKNKAVNSRSS